MSTDRAALAWLGTGVALGGAFGWFSPAITGHAEPWDADAPVWGLSWLVVALAGGAAGRPRGILLPIGYAAGQMLATLRITLTGEFGFLGWIFIAAYAAPAIAVAAALAGIWALVRRMRHNRVR